MSDDGSWIVRFGMMIMLMIISFVLMQIETDLHRIADELRDLPTTAEAKAA